MWIFSFKNIQCISMQVEHFLPSRDHLLKCCVRRTHSFAQADHCPQLLLFKIKQRKAVRPSAAQTIRHPGVPGFNRAGKAVGRIGRNEACTWSTCTSTSSYPLQRMRASSWRLSFFPTFKFDGCILSHTTCLVNRFFVFFCTVICFLLKICNMTLHMMQKTCGLII